MQKTKTLYAFHDFRVTWPCFDYFGFLIHAEWTRRKVGAENLHVVFVPKPESEDHADFNFTPMQTNWRLNNLVVPGTWLLPSCRSISVCNTVEEAREIYENWDGPIFPHGYSIDKPLLMGDPCWPALIANFGDNIQYLRATPQSLEYVNNWKRAHSAGKKIVSITIRNTNYNEQRNSDLDLWAKFALWLQQRDYYPVIVPDTDTALQILGNQFLGIPSIPAAALNLEIRMALYEVSFLNTFVSNGPAYMCCFDRNIHFLNFRTGEFLAEPKNIESFQGIPYGTNPPYLNQFQNQFGEN